MATLAERIAESLLATGFTEAKSPSKRYRKFLNPTLTYTLWLGKVGALRGGDTVNTSVPYPATRERLLKLWDERHPTTFYGRLRGTTTGFAFAAPDIARAKTILAEKAGVHERSSYLIVTLKPTTGVIYSHTAF